MVKNTENNILLSNNYYLFCKDTLDIDYIKSILSENTSVIYFNENFESSDSMLELFRDKYFDKLIIISKSSKIKPQKRLFVSSRLNKKILEHTKKKIFVIIKLDNEYKIVKNTIENLILLNQFCSSLNLNICNKMEDMNILSYIVNNNSKYFYDIVSSFNALLCDTKKERYEYIYDIVCNYLDNEFTTKNICDFKNDQCYGNRQKGASHSSMGCCYSFTYTHFLDPRLIKDVKLCKHLDCKTCTTQCMACKLFTCKYLKERGIYFKPDEILLLDCFFTKKQHLILKHNFFKKREDIINKLLENTSTPYFIYYLNGMYDIK